MKVYFVRHGESQGNKTEIHQVPETPLTEEGEKQAQALSERARNLGIDFIYSSTHLRARQTAEIISQKIGKPVEHWGNLVELRNPTEIWGLPYQHPESERIRSLIRKNFTKGNWKYSDEENFEELKERGLAVLNHLVKNHRRQTVLCVAHGTFTMMILALVIFGEKLTPRMFLNFRHHVWIHNTGLTLFEYTEKSKWSLLTWNDRTHL